MGHAVNVQREHRLLRRAMDRNPTCVPETPVLLEILALVYAPEEARIAGQLPMRPVSLEDLARRLHMPEADLDAVLTGLAQRGLVLDVENGGRRFFALPPVLGGIFEFIYMRVREGTPLTELARLFDEYMDRDPTFARQSYSGETQFARAFVREEALPQDDYTEILDWERVTRVIETASAISIALCPCRHKASHLGKACDAPQRTCISLNGGAEAMIHMDISKRIDTREALSVVEECKRAGLVQCGDNVQKSVTFLCNCCGCCCTMVRAIRTFDLRHAIVSSNRIASAAPDRCKSCGKCAEACPVGAIVLRDGTGAARPVFEEDLCLGCGVCATVCKSGAIAMTPRPRRVLTPETAFEKSVRCAIERGRLADLFFDNPERLGRRALGSILSILEKSPPGRAALAIRPLRSAFLNWALQRASA